MIVLKCDGVLVCLCVVWCTPGAEVGPLLKMGGHWYKLDASYRNKRRWMCARGCGARIHTAGKRVVFSELRHRCRNQINHTI